MTNFVYVTISNKLFEEMIRRTLLMCDSWHDHIIATECFFADDSVSEITPNRFIMRSNSTIYSFTVVG